MKVLGICRALYLERAAHPTSAGSSPGPDSFIPTGAFSEPRPQQKLQREWGGSGGRGDSRREGREDSCHPSLGLT